MKNKKFSNVDDLVTDLLGEKDSSAFIEGMHKHRTETATISELVLNRVKQGLTQCEVARRMGVSPSKVCRMEDSVDADLSYEDIQKYSGAIGLRPMIVFETKEQPHDIASFVYSIGTLLEQLKGLLPSSSGFGEKLTNVYGDVLFPIALKSAQAIRRNGVSRVALVVMLSVLSIGASAESRVDKMLSSYEYFWQKKYHRGNGSLLPVDEQTKCHELALLGGQPVFTRTMQSDIDKWANSNLVKTPRHYKATMPKRALAQDAILKQRRELLLPRTQELRELIIDAYENEVQNPRHLKPSFVSAVGSFRVVLPNQNYNFESPDTQGGIQDATQGGLKSGLQSGLKSGLKTVQKSALNPTDAKIVEWLAEDAHMTILALVDKLDLSRNGIKKALNRLKSAGAIRRVGPDKGGHWEVVG